MCDDIDSTWKQVERHLKADGFREGATSGQESTTAAGFKDGYSQGLRLGVIIGKSKGKLALAKCLNKGIETSQTESIENNCEICIQQNSESASSDYTELTYDQIKSAQDARYQQCQERLIEQKLLLRSPEPQDINTYQNC